MDIDLLRSAVTAKQAYWDSVFALEKALGGELSDEQCSKIHAFIDELAAVGEAHTLPEATIRWFEQYVKGVQCV